MNIIQKLKKANLINPPLWLEPGIQYLVQTGSRAYGIDTEESDVDLYGITIPPLDSIFPHLNGDIPGFGRQIKRFEQYQEAHIIYDNLEYDITIYNIVKCFQLLMDNNPNMIDMLFAPNCCIVYQTQIGKLIRNNRHIFLHKGCYWRFMGYAESQWKKIRNKNPQGKRKERVDKYGYDTKYASHLVRLSLECEQILTDHDLNIETNKDILLEIRNGDMSLKEIEVWFGNKKKSLEQLYNSSKLQHSPDENKIKNLLLICLTMCHGKENVPIEMF